MKYKIFKQSGHKIEIQSLLPDIDATNLPMVQYAARYQISQLADAGDWKSTEPSGLELSNWTNSKGEHIFVTCDD